MKTIKNLAFTATIALALIVQLVNPISVRADGETPPPTDAPEVTSTPAPEETATEATATESPIALGTPTAEPIITDTSAPPTDAPTEATDAPSATATEEPVTSSTPVPTTDSPTEEPATPEAAATVVATEVEVAQQPTVLETVQQMPEATSVVVLDETGQPLPLASQDAATVIAAGDPMWCPGNTIPVGGAGCSTSYGSLLDLVNNFVPYADGTIWIAAGVDSSGSTVMIDGNGNWSLANSFALTLQGGVGGTASIFNVPIAIYNWNNDVTLNDITINNTTIAGHGLTIDTSGNVNLQNITSNGNINNPGDGAYIDNTRGTGNVVVTGQNDFSTHNQWNSGMYILSRGDVVLDGVTSNSNGRGINISQARNVTVTNSTFNDNSYDFDGLYIVANGNVTLDGLTANNNGNGVYIPLAANVTVTNSIFSDNLYDGFLVTNAIGDVHLGQVSAIHNGDNGAYIINNGGINIHNSSFTQNWVGTYIQTQGDATVDSSSFSSNQYDGLRIFAIGNQVLLNNSQFNHNNQVGWDGYGAWISAGSTGDITVTNSEFNNNFAGLVAFSSNNIYILKDAKDNQFQYNALGIGYYDCRGTLVLDPSVAFLGNDYDIFNWGGCPNPVSTTVTGTSLPPVFASGGKFSKYVDCAIQAPPPVSLPNGDMVEIHCPVSGFLDIARLDSTTLPALPEGYTYASAFDVKIHNKNRTINVIPNGGSITASFLANYLQSGNAYSILYWDETNQQWIQLKDYLTEGNAARKFFLDPEDQNPRREIKSGVRLITRYRSPRVEVEVNFPGTFVLAQH